MAVNKDNTHFTGIYDVDLEILLNLEDKDLANLCQTNKYFHRLCREDVFWQRRIARKISPLLIREKYPSLSWHQWYNFWKKHSNALPLIQSGKLTLLQAYVFIASSSDDELLPDSKIYQTLDLVLVKALEKHNDTYISALIKEFDQLYGQSLFTHFNIDEDGSDDYNFNSNDDDDEVIIPNISLTGFVDVIITALENGYRDIAYHVIDFIGRYEMIKHDNEDDLILLVKKTGFINEVEFYEEYLRDFVERLYGTSHDSYFIEGLVEGGHLESAKAFYPKANANWFELLDIATASDDFGRYLATQVPLDERQDFLFQIRHYQPTGSNDVFISNPYNITSDILDLVNMQINSGKEPNVRINYRDNISLFTRFINEEKGNKDKVIAYLIGDAICRGITDLIFSLDFNDSYFNDEDVWNSILFYCYNPRNKGLYLYLMIELASKFPELFQVYDRYPFKQSYEIYLLGEILQEYDISDLIVSNMYDILVHVFSPIDVIYALSFVNNENGNNNLPR